MKKTIALLMLAVFLAGGIFSAAAFAAPGKRPQGEALAAIPKGELTENDVHGLLLMREEEKLAMDLYRELGA